MKNIKCYTVAIILLLSALTGCSRLNTDITPDARASYHSTKMKFNVKNRQNNQRQNFKVLLKYNNQGDKMFFLSPLNQIYGILIIENERATLVNTKKKRYWKGEFRYLLQYMWGNDMDFRYDQFKQLITRGTLPQALLEEKGIQVTLDKAPGMEAPQAITLTNSEIRVKVKISEQKILPGSLSLKIQLKNMIRGGIAETLE